MSLERTWPESTNVVIMLDCRKPAYWLDQDGMISREIVRLGDNSWAGLSKDRLAGFFSPSPS